MNQQDNSLFVSDENVKKIFAQTIYASYRPSLPILFHVKRWFFGINLQP